MKSVAEVLIRGYSNQWFPWLVMRLDGRASTTFVIVAGVGLALVSRRSRDAQDREGLAVVRSRLWRLTG